MPIEQPSGCHVDNVNEIIYLISRTDSQVILLCGTGGIFLGKILPKFQGLNSRTFCGK